MILLKHNNPFFEYEHTSYHSYKTSIKGDKFIVEVEAPGKDREEIDITYEDENRCFLIKIEEAQPLRVYVTKVIDIENIGAKLEKGMLTVEVPIINKDKQIEIK